MVILALVYPLSTRDGVLQMEGAVQALKQRNDSDFRPEGLDIVHAKWLSKKAGLSRKASYSEASHARAGQFFAETKSYLDRHFSGLMLESEESLAARPV